MLTSAASVKAIGEKTETAQQTDIEGLFVEVSPVGGEKCDRCWHHTSDVGTIDGHEKICGRCVSNVRVKAKHVNSHNPEASFLHQSEGSAPVFTGADCREFMNKIMLKDSGVRWLWLALVIFLADIGIKLFVMDNMDLGCRGFFFFNFIYVHTGAAFSFLSDQ